MLARDKWATWLGEHRATAEGLRWMILRPCPAELLRAYPVDGPVGNVRNNDPELLKELAA